MEKKDKPLGEWTLNEIKEECEKWYDLDCRKCRIYEFCINLLEGERPGNWDLSEKPRLTERELEICRLLGAKWLSRDDKENSIDLWKDAPEYFEGNYIDGGMIGFVPSDCFPSVKPGDCICVKEFIGNE